MMKYKRIKKMEKEIAALKEEQLAIKKYVKESIELDKNLLEIVKNFKEELSRIKISDTNVTEQFSEVSEKETWFIDIDKFGFLIGSF